MIMRIHRRGCRWATVCCFLWLPVQAEETQFDPEIDANLRLNHRVRLNFQAKEERDAGDPIQTSIGPGVELHLKPIARLKDLTTFDLNDAKSRFLVLEAGYRYITAPDTAITNRLI